MVAMTLDDPIRTGIPYKQTVKTPHKWWILQQPVRNIGIFDSVCIKFQWSDKEYLMIHRLHKK